MNKNEIFPKLAGLDNDQRRDWYYLASQAMNGKQEACEAVAARFGDASPETCHAITMECYTALTQAELKAEHDQAIRELQAIAHTPPEAADEVLNTRNADICPLLAIRTAKGLTQAKLAALSGVNVRQIRRIEIGEAKIGNITLDNALALADALGVDVSELRGNS